MTPIGFRELPHWSEDELHCAPTIPGVSFVIPAFNASKTLFRCVGSCFEQSTSPLEVIVVDDHSIDATPAVVDDLRGVFGIDLGYVRNYRNLGVSAARNRGARVACGEYLCYLDADDIAPPQRVEQVLIEFAAGADMIYGQQEFFDGNDLSRRMKLRPKTELPTVRNYLGCGCGGSAISVRRSLHLDRGIWWDEQMGVAEDADFLLACLSAGVQVECSDNVYSYRRRSNESLTHKGDWVTMREYMRKKYQKWTTEHFGSGN